VPAVAAQFDTVLARESAEEDRIEHPLDSEFMLVFSLIAPADNMSRRSQSLSGPCHLQPAWRLWQLPPSNGVCRMVYASS